MSNESPTPAEIARLQHERDLYRRLLELGHQSDLRPLLEQALHSIVDVTGAQRGYIEIYAEVGTDPQLSISQGCSEEEVAQIRAVTSRGIVGHAMATGQTVHTPSALLDERFSANVSVRRQGIEAVLCAPIGRDHPLGVLYLQGRPGGGPFSDPDVRLAEDVALHIAPAIARLLAAQRSQQEADPTKPWRQKLDVTNLIGRSASLARVLEQVAPISRLDITVLITGPSGTGKTHLARAIHDNSARRSAPFIEVSCTNIPENLFESEIFGVMAGAHSTADRDRAGRVAAADGGTLFFDEIGELAPGIQKKLLQLLQSKTYLPLGASDAVQADIRIIAATNADLQALVKQKLFREDLYFRINVVSLAMPPLSERAEDIVPLAEHFIGVAARRHSLIALPLSPASRMAIELSSWPGNVRELDHVVEMGLVRAISEGANAIEQKHLFPGTTEPERLPTFQEATRKAQRAFLEQTLNAVRWNIADAARVLDLTRGHVYNLIKAHGLDRE